MSKDFDETLQRLQKENAADFVSGFSQPKLYNILFLYPFLFLIWSIILYAVHGNLPNWLALIPLILCFAGSSFAIVNFTVLSRVLPSPG